MYKLTTFGNKEKNLSVSQAISLLIELCDGEDLQLKCNPYPYAPEVYSDSIDSLIALKELLESAYFECSDIGVE